jgi:3'(2'), 5'-bisphosphate nucleotidase
VLWKYCEFDVDRTFSDHSENIKTRYQLLENSQSLATSDIDFVLDMARQAGELAVAMRQGVEVREKTGPSDLVTAADLALSSFIVERLHARFPNDLVISEEDETHFDQANNSRIWLVDPIDGTDNYLANDGQYSVMIGLLVDKEINFGCVYAPAYGTTYHGGLKYGAWKTNANGKAMRYSRPAVLNTEADARLMMGYRDRKLNPWVMAHAKVRFVKAGSVGLKVAKILEDEADLFVHFAKKLKVWDTAGPVAIALGGGLEVGTLQEDVLGFPLPSIIHETSVIVGKPNALEWCRLHLAQSEAKKAIQHDSHL